MPTPIEEGFDPLGELELLEDLLYQDPSVWIEKDQPEDSQPEMKVRLNEVKRKRHVELLDGGSPPKSSKPRKRRWRHLDREMDRMHVACKGDRFLHYMPRIRFGPVASESFLCFHCTLTKGIDLLRSRLSARSRIAIGSST
ncbi:hypothetical protein L1987_24895 [Smallanthus sonchifolius]|uniref:Uncharacterized protein n=1 Tax=Smallanthus sonchifolius TaxID=185202 RepID=A0ACB9IPE1_9ASTR|nr:hypothetical protein L1987_24895 [Smallanthus sonchifolius]